MLWILIGPSPNPTRPFPDPDLAQSTVLERGRISDVLTVPIIPWNWGSQQDKINAAL